METNEIIKEYSDSIEISVNAKGEPSCKIKAYDDCRTEEGQKRLSDTLNNMGDIAFAKMQEIKKQNE